MRKTFKLWQERESGPLVKPKSNTHPWYNSASWRTVFRPAALRRHPLCQQCERVAATHVDHIIDFITELGFISWELFRSAENHRSLCASCHSRKTATIDGGFGNARKPGFLALVMSQPTGEGGKEFSSGTKKAAALDKAIGTQAEIDELLSGIPK
jgi:hypothetical protein